MTSASKWREALKWRKTLKPRWNFEVEKSVETKIKHCRELAGDRNNKNLVALDMTAASKWREALKWRKTMKPRWSFEVKKSVETKIKHWSELEGDRFNKHLSHSMWPLRRSEGKRESEGKRDSKRKRESEGERESWGERESEIQRPCFLLTVSGSERSDSQ